MGEGKTDELHICTHFSYLTNLYHDKLFNFWISLFVVSHFGCGERSSSSDKVLEAGMTEILDRNPNPTVTYVIRH
jgi:hypothetical protein